MRFVFDVGVWFGPNDVRHQPFVIIAGDLDDAMHTVVAWVMTSGRESRRSRKPQNVTSLQLVSQSE